MTTYFVAVLLFILTSSMSWAQTSTAQVTGRVTDPSGSVIAQADVRVINTDTQVVRDSKTNSTGYYTVPLLPPGPYQIAVSAPGFKSMTRSGVVLVVDQVGRVDFALEIGASNESINVTAQSELLDTSTGSLGQLVQGEQITELPTNGRNTLAFVELTPGVRMQPGANSNPNTIATNARGNFAINGGVSNANEVLVDGAPVTLARSNAVGYLPPVDATQEFRVETNSYSAEYDRTAGGVVNLTIKNGTDRFHGTLFEFLRNDVFDANLFFSNKAGLPKPPFKQNQYGASLGGPIRRNKTFFFGNFEGFNLVQGINLTGTVPSLLQRQGNFSQTFTAARQLIQIADPATTVLGSNGTYTRSLFAGNIIPASQINPVAAKWTQLFWPLPNQPGNALTGVNNFATSGSQPTTADQGVGRLDHSINDKWKLFATYAQQRITPGFADLLGNGISPLQTDYADNTITNDAVLAATAVLSPTLVVELRSGFIRLQQHREPGTVPFDETKLGLPASLNLAESFQTTPLFSVAGFTAPAAISGNVTLSTSNSFDESGSVTWIRGAQTLKFGGAYRVLQLNDVASAGLSPNLSFTAQFTALNPLASSTTSGNALASFLLGDAATGSMNTAVPLADQRRYGSVFFQDDWKVTPKLTLNLGIRYSLDTSNTERYNRLSWFNPTAVPPIGQTVGLPLAGALNFATNGQRTPEELYLKEWSPRFGFAYQLFPKTVIRGGYGVFWLPGNLSEASTSVRSTPWSATTTFVGSQNGGITPYDTLSNPFPNGVIPPTGPSQGLNSLIGQALSVYLQSNHDGYVQQWNFNIQQSIWKNLVAQVAYVANKGTGLPLTIDLNQLPTQYMSMGTALTQPVANPFYKLVTTGVLASATVPRSQLLRPYPQFDSIQAVSANAGSSSYSAFQSTVTDRMGPSLIQAAYTFSKTIGDSESQTASIDGTQPGGGLLSNNYNRRQDRSLEEFDAPQRFILSYTVDLPFGKGQKFLSHAGWMDRLVSGWQLTGIYTAQSGTPLYLTTATNLTNSYVSFSRPNNNGTSAELSGTAQSRLNEWFNTSVFSAPPAFTFGNVGRTLPDVRNDGMNNLDAGLFKNNPFGPDGRYKLQFRTEFFNLANRVQFANPGLVYGNAAFGVISAQSNTPRQIQFALKLLF